MSLYGSGVEYGLHCLLHLVDGAGGGLPSSREVAEFQGVSPSYVAKLFTRLEKAGLITATEGIGGGFRLARPPESITVLEVVDALEAYKPLFNCREIRGQCVLYGESPPPSATRGVCGIHAVMLEAERQMRAVLSGRTLADLAGVVAEKTPARFRGAKARWFDRRHAGRRRRTTVNDP